jgi:hypothetical protein
MGRMDPGNLVRIAVLTAAAGLLAACTSPGSSSSTPTAASASAFAAIVEPFDPGHLARTGPALGSCDAATATLAIERCYDAKTENALAPVRQPGGWRRRGLPLRPRLPSRPVGIASIAIASL